MTTTILNWICDSSVWSGANLLKFGSGPFSRALVEHGLQLVGVHPFASGIVVEVYRPKPD